MKMVQGIQRREPYSHSANPYSHYYHRVGCKEFVVERRSSGKDVSVEVFFPRASAPKQGVGISLPSIELAVAVGRALLTVAEGCVDKMEGSFE